MDWILFFSIFLALIGIAYGLLKYLKENVWEWDVDHFNLLLVIFICSICFYGIIKLTKF